jgi:hypothetical protein
MLIERHIGIAFNGLAIMMMAPSALSGFQGHPQPYHPLVGIALALAVVGIVFSTSVAATHESPLARWGGFIFCGLLAAAFAYGHLLCAMQVSHPNARALALVVSAVPFLLWVLIVWKFRRDPA